MIVSFHDLKIQSSQKYSAYASYIRHYGGQVYDSNFPFYTHQFLPTPEQFQALPKNTTEDEKEENNQILNNLLLKLYSYFLSGFYLHHRNSSTNNDNNFFVSRPITHFPISISGLWIESSLHISSYYLSSSSFIHHSIRSSTSYTISSIISQILQNFPISDYILKLQNNKKSSTPSTLPWDYSLSDCSYLPLLQSVQSFKSQKKNIFNKKCNFLVSSQYSDVMKQNIIDVIRLVFSFIF